MFIAALSHSKEKRVSSPLLVFLTVARLCSGIGLNKKKSCQISTTRLTIQASWKEAQHQQGKLFRVEVMDLRGLIHQMMDPQQLTWQKWSYERQRT